MIATAITFIRSTFFAIGFYGGSALLVLAALVVYPIHAPLIDPVTRAWARWHYWCCRRLLGQRLVIEGDLADAPVLYAFKHESMYETIEMPRLFAKPAVMAKRELFNIPFWGKVARDYGLVPVDREAGAGALREMIATARKANKDGRPICLFPEGTRVTHGESPPLRSGFAGLYKLLALPVVPVALDSGRLSPRGKFMKRSGIITFRVGEAIPPGLDRDEAEAKVHAAMNVLNR